MFEIFTVNCNDKKLTFNNLCYFSLVSCSIRLFSSSHESVGGVGKIFARFDVVYCVVWFNTYYSNYCCSISIFVGTHIRGFRSLNLNWNAISNTYSTVWIIVHKYTYPWNCNFHSIYANWYPRIIMKPRYIYFSGIKLRYCSKDGNGSPNNYT